MFGVFSIVFACGRPLVLFIDLYMDVAVIRRYFNFLDVVRKYDILIFFIDLAVFRRYFNFVAVDREYYMLYFCGDLVVLCCYCSRFQEYQDQLAHCLHLLN